MASTGLALVTGASMGLGAEYARQLAARGVHLVLTARSEAPMEALAEELRNAHRVQVHVFPCDLAQPGAAGQIVRFLEENNHRPNWLINNAGFGEAGPFERMPADRIRDMCMLNMVALTELTSRMLPILKQAPAGTARILNIASVAGFQSVPYFAVYSATKAYVLSFTEALHEELRPAGIRVTCVAPGYTATNFAHNSGIQKKIFTSAQSAEEVVRDSLRASDRGKALIVHRNHLQILATRLVPRAVVRKAAAQIAKTYKP